MADPDEEPSPDQASNRRHPFGAFDLEAVAQAMRGATIDHAAVRRALREATNIDYDAVAKAVEAMSQIEAEHVQKALRQALPPTVVVVPEDDDEAVEEDEPPTDSENTDGLSALASELGSLGVEVELQGSGDRARLELSLPAGRSSRPVSISANEVSEVDATRLVQWRSLERYDGLWSGDLGQLVIAIRGERFGPPPRRLLDRQDEFWHATEAGNGVEYRFAEASGEVGVLLSPHRYRQRLRTFVLSVSGLSLDTTAQADALAEEISDSLLFDIDVRTGIRLSPRRLETRPAIRGGVQRRRESAISAPENRYAHAPMLLYRSGRDRITAPLIRYWTLYQVLEYFFPQFVKQEALRQLSRLLRNPGFDAHRDSDVRRVVEVISKTSGSSLPEREQLRLTIQAIATPDELLEVVQLSGAAQQLADKKCPLSKKVVTNSRSDVGEQLAERIYDIRCSIVHSKSDHPQASGPGVLPETDEDDLIRAELPIMEFLAQQALIGTAEPLRLPTPPTSEMGDSAVAGQNE